MSGVNEEEPRYDDERGEVEKFVVRFMSEFSETQRQAVSTAQKQQKLRDVATASAMSLFSEGFRKGHGNGYGTGKAEWLDKGIEALEKFMNLWKACKALADNEDDQSLEKLDQMSAIVQGVRDLEALEIMDRVEKLGEES